MSNTDFLSIHDIREASIWMAADGSSYGLLVTGKDLDAEDILVKRFDSNGWVDNCPGRIDWFKLQYRYKQVC
jgi:hypothetical protein